MRVALIHDWLTGMRGGEKVLDAMCEVFPAADLFTLVHVPGSTSPQIDRRRIVRSIVQRLPAATRRYREYLPLFPFAIEQFDLSGYDLIISSSYAVAKGVITGPDQLHLSYVHSPVRFAWDLQHQYLRQAGPTHGLTSWIVRALLHRLCL